MPNLILASASPRRKELLDQIGVHFKVCPVHIDESIQPNEMAEQYVHRLALEKAMAGYRLDHGLPALGSDTVVVVNNQILGKPKDKIDAQRMLELLSNSTHQVMTGIALVRGDEVLSKVVTTNVCFEILNDIDIDRYIATGEPTDKAGAYGIQGKAAVFVKRIEGSYSNVVGLPLAETAELLKLFNVPIWAHN